METTANRLVQSYLNIKRRTGHAPDWADHVKDSKSFAILCRQFIALTKAINLQIEQPDAVKVVKAFENGDFIKKRPFSNYSIIAGELELHEPQLIGYNFWEKEIYQYWQLDNLFEGLLRFKVNTDFRYGGAFEGLEVGGSYAHSLAVAALDKAAISKIDTVLSLLIDPDQSVSDIPMLIKQYGYPVEDYEKELRMEYEGW